MSVKLIKKKLLISFFTIWAIGVCEAEEKKELPEMVVTANRTEVELQDTPAVATVFNEEQIKKPGNKNFLDPLKSIPGIKINARQNNGIFGGGIDIRGMSTNATSGGNVKILLDGIPQHRLSLGGPYMGAIPFAAVEKMELVKGPFITQYGRGGLTGALQLFTLEGGDEFKGKFSTDFESETDFFRQTLQLSGPVAGMEKSSYAVTFSNDTANGWQYDTDSHHQDFYGKLKLQLTEADTLTLIAAYYDGYDDVATQIFIDDNGNKLPYLDWNANLSPNGYNWCSLDETRLVAVWEHDFNQNTSMKLTNSYWSGNTSWGVNRPWNGDPMLTNDFAARYMRLDWREQSNLHELQMQHKYILSDLVDGVLTGGVSFENYDWNNDSYNYGTVITNPVTGVIDNSGLNLDNPSHANSETTASFTGVFVTNRLNIGDNLSVDMGLRFDHYRCTQYDVTQATSDTADHDYVSPALGINYHLIRNQSNGLSMFANWGKNFNPILRTGVNAGLIGTDPEESETSEFGFKGYAFDRMVDAALTFYRIERTDVAQKIGSEYFNSDDWQTDGVELALGIRPVKEMRFYCSLALSNPQITKSDKLPANVDNQIMWASEKLLTLGADYHHGNGFGCGVQSRYVGDTFADSANTVSVDSYWLTDLSVAYNWGNKELSLFVNNVFDEKYYSGAFDDSRGYVFAGTPRTLGLRFSMSF